MANKLIGLNGKVVAVIDGNGTCIQRDIDESELNAPGYDRFSDLTGTLRCGSLYDAKTAQFDRQEKVILEIIFRLVNDVRTLKGQATITPAQFKTYVISLME